MAWSLSREESKSHRDCKHVVAGAEAQTFDPAQLAALFPGGNLDTRVPVREKGRLETWRIRSCDDVTAYHVLLVTASDGTTAFVVHRAAQ